jgi:hypothetical protein
MLIILDEVRPQLNLIACFSDLTRLALVNTYIYHDPSTYFALPSIVELTLENTILIVTDSYKSGTPLPFLTENHFPSLRALGLQGYSLTTLASASSPTTSPHRSFLAQLDCITVDEDTQLRGLPLRLSVPFLYDVDPASFPLFQTNRIVSQARLYLMINMESASTKTHVRIRFPCEPIAPDHQIEAALSFVDNLLIKSTLLEELYLDLYPRDGRRDYGLSQNLEKKIEKLEKLAKDKKVEIVWENHEDDWCRSRISKEFWRRWKGKKEM